MVNASSRGNTPSTTRAHTPLRTGFIPSVPVGQHQARGTFERSSSPRPRSNRRSFNGPETAHEEEQGYAEFILRLERLENLQRNTAQHVASETQQMSDIYNMLMEDRSRLDNVCAGIDELLVRVSKLTGGLGCNVLAPIQKPEDGGCKAPHWPT